MSRWADVLTQAQASQANIRFADLCGLVKALGYEKRSQRGSHLIYKHTVRRDLPLINLQSDGNKAKPYQVRQVLGIVETYRLEVVDR